VFCDYAKPNFNCKPEPPFYHEAMVRAGISDPSKCFFVDDSLKNVRVAKSLGWGSCVYYKEPPSEDSIATKGAAVFEQTSKIEGVDAVISSLEELRAVWPQLFKPSPT